MLKKLNLSRNDFSFVDEGPNPSCYTTMDLFISQNKFLEELNLNDCKIGPDGASILGRALRRNQKLVKLHLSQNILKDKGLLFILEGIYENILALG